MRAWLTGVGVAHMYDSFQEEMVSRLQTQIQDLERYIQFLQGMCVCVLMSMHL